jgi:hypothetical protein
MKKSRQLTEYLTFGNPLEGRPDLVQDDNIHPTDDAQKVLAAAIDQALIHT